MALRQITRATCRHLNRPTLSLLSIYTQTPASTPPSFLLPSSHSHGLHPTTRTTTIQRRNAVTNARFPVAPNLGPQFINEVRVRFPYDDEITAYNPTYIDETGALVGVYPIDQILRAYDRNKYHLIHISGVDRLTDESEGHIVRLFPKSLLLERLEAERRAEREASNAEDVDLPGFKKKKKKSGKDITKEVQISWGIDKNDLNTHLKKIGKFLEKGNTVEVMIARKKKQVKPPQAKLDEMMEIIEEFMYYNGGVDLKKRSGEVGTQLTMVVQRPDDWVQPPPRPKKEVEEDEPIDEVEFEKLQKERQERIEIEQGGRVQEVTGGKKHVPAWQARGEVP
ncbi:hypothetical protein TWF106_002824 [Orbilia oligospora]|uniref:Uncharacterized protein n=1 Tax=Orbilia oligospora TaxID=2813651 RepID=A0A6G1M721_ORBOL|nr:hypothetical protein TWF788_002198 [Orbilia oligospora]KAF3201404.1 hypothetical protein TWF106_002824 [Orbilia oligospora]KAF3247690.1 hypothetical protein TWF192_006547 [Orbilia oligospora]